MKKITKQLMTLAEAILEGLDDETKKVLEEANDEDKIAEIGDKVLNAMGNFKSKLESKGRESVYQGLDAKVFEDTELAEIIGKEKFDKIKQAKGVDKHAQLNTAYKEAIKATKAAKSDAGTDKEAKAYQEQLLKVQGEYEAFKAQSAKDIEDAKAQIIGQYDAEILGERLYNTVISKGNLADNYKNDKFIRKMVVSDMLETATGKGLKIDPKTLNITKQDGTPHFVGGGKTYDIDSLLEETIQEDWRKKSEPAPSGPVSAGGSPKPNSYRVDPVRAAASKSSLGDN